MKYAPCNVELRKAEASRNSVLPSNQALASVCGNSSGRCSWNSTSIAMMTLTGAFRIFGWFCSDVQAASLAFAASLTHHTRRAGNWLADVGPHFISSQIACSWSSVTGSSV